MELTITKEKVLEAASKCSTAEATLKVLFPEVFVKENNRVVEDLARLLNNTDYSWFESIPGHMARGKAKWVYNLIEENKNLITK